MIELKRKEDCVGCRTCSMVCPRHCIKMVQDDEGFIYPQIDTSMCIDCGKCELVCPVLNDFVVDGKMDAWYGAYNKKRDVQIKSSSGAAFYELATYVLERKGLVWGAAWTEQNTVKHVCIQSPDELYKIQKSKYLQSDLGNAFELIKKQLTENYLVLFSGTPCQVKALLLFLKSHSKNLITVEVVCHGVSSPRVFQSYMSANKLKSVDFRSKEKGWYNYEVKLVSESGNVQTMKATENLYMKGFLKDLFNRPSCTQCPAKSFKSGADYTLGDFWGVEYVVPDLFDQGGVSLIGMHTVKARNNWKEIKSSFIYKSVDYEEAVKYNASMVKSAVASRDRESFFKDLNDQGIMKALTTYTAEVPSCEKSKQQWSGDWKNQFKQYAIRTREYLYRKLDLLYSRLHKSPQIESVATTLQYILTHKCSVFRFGEEELELMEGRKKLPFKLDPVLETRLKTVLQTESSHLIQCIPDVFTGLNQYRSRYSEYLKIQIVRTRKNWYQHLSMDRIYYNAFINQCYTLYADKTNVQLYFDRWKAIWKDRDLLIVEGEKTRLGLDSDFFHTANSIKRILCPKSQAEEWHKELLEECQQFSKDHLILVAVDSMTGLLVLELTDCGYQTIDARQIGDEYEWYLVQENNINQDADKTSETELDEKQYRSQIVCRL